MMKRMLSLFGLFALVLIFSAASLPSKAVVTDLQVSSKTTVVSDGTLRQIIEVFTVTLESSASTWYKSDYHAVGTYHVWDAPNIDATSPGGGSQTFTFGEGPWGYIIQSDYYDCHALAKGTTFNPVTHQSTQWTAGSADRWIDVP